MPCPHSSRAVQERPADLLGLPYERDCARHLGLQGLGRAPHLRGRTGKMRDGGWDHSPFGRPSAPPHGALLFRMAYGLAWRAPALDFRPTRLRRLRRGPSRWATDKVEDDYDSEETDLSRRSDRSRRRVDCGSGPGAIWWWLRWWRLPRRKFRRRELPRWRLRRGFRRRVCSRSRLRRRICSRRLHWTTRLHRAIGFLSWPLGLGRWLGRRSDRPWSPRCLVVLDLGTNGFRLATSLGVQFRLGRWLGRRRLGLGQILRSPKKKRRQIALG
jgi:hypothetical protein